MAKDLKAIQKYFKKAGIDKEYFSEIFEQPIDGYEIRPVEKGSLLRAELYEFNIHPDDKNKEPLNCH